MPANGCSSDRLGTGSESIRKERIVTINLALGMVGFQFRIKRFILRKSAAFSTAAFGSIFQDHVDKSMIQLIPK
jgi:hypothetical protein